MKPKIFLSILVLLGQIAFAGDKTLNGGDDIAMEFQQAFYGAMLEISKNQPELYAQIREHDLSSVAKGAEFLIVDTPLKVVLGGIEQESVAANEPATKTIYINRARWRSITDVRVFEGIALHEVASLKGLERTGVYTYSAQYLSIFSLSTTTLASGTSMDHAEKMDALTSHPSGMTARIYKGTSQRWGGAVQSCVVEIQEYYAIKDAKAVITDRYFQTDTYRKVKARVAFEKSQLTKSDFGVLKTFKFPVELSGKMVWIDVGDMTTTVVNTTTMPDPSQKSNRRLAKTFAYHDFTPYSEFTADHYPVNSRLENKREFRGVTYGDDQRFANEAMAEITFSRLTGPVSGWVGLQLGTDRPLQYGQNFSCSPSESRINCFVKAKLWYEGVPQWLQCHFGKENQKQSKKTSAKQKGKK